MVTAYQKFY